MRWVRGQIRRSSGTQVVQEIAVQLEEGGPGPVTFEHEFQGFPQKDRGFRISSPGHRFEAGLGCHTDLDGQRFLHADKGSPFMANGNYNPVSGEGSSGCCEAQQGRTAAGGRSHDGQRSFLTGGSR
jgi:hypothetical protein